MGIDDALRMVDSMQSDEASQASFVQMSKHINKLSLHATHSLTSFGAILSTMVQLKESSTDELFVKLKGLFTNFKNETLETAEHEAKVEAAAVASFDNQKKRLSTIISKLLTQIENLNVESKELKKCLTVQTLI